MPLKLPDVTSLGPRDVPTPPGGGASYTPPAPTGIVSSATSTLAASLGRMGAELEHEQKLEQDRVDTTRAEEAFNQLRSQQIDLTLGEENGFTRQKGSAAVNRQVPLNKEYLDRFDKISQQIEAALTTDTQKLKYRSRAAVARQQMAEQLLRHMAAEGETYSRETFEGTVLTEARAAVANWDSPNDIGLSLYRIEQAVDARAEKLNWPKEYRDAVLLEKTSLVHKAVVQQALASGDYLYAQRWYQENKDAIDLPTAKAVEHAVQEGTQKQIAAAYTADYLANQNNRKVLEQLHTKILADVDLDETRKNMLVGRVQNRMAVLEHKAELAQERHLRRLERGINELNANTLAGFEPTAEQFASVINAARGTELEPAVKQAVQLAGATRSFRNAPPAVQERLLTEAEAGVRKDPSKFDRRVVSAWRTIFDAQRAQVRESSVTFAVRQGLVDPPKPLDLAQPHLQGEPLAERFAIARAMSARYQVPMKPLTAEETTLLSTTLKSAPAEEKRKYFAGLAQASGQDYEGYSAIMGQIAPDDPATAVAGTYAFRGRTQASDLILRGQAILNPPRKEDGKPDGGKLWPMPPEKDLRVGWQGYEKDAFAGHAGARNAMYQAALAIYAAKSVEEGDSSAVLNTGRWEEAMRLATGGIEKHKGRAIVLPYGYEYGQFRDVLRAKINLVAEQGRLAKGVTPAAIEDLPLEAIGDGRYVFRVGDGILVDKESRPILIDFNQSLPFRSSGDAIQQKDREPTPEELEAARQPVRGRVDPLAAARRKAQIGAPASAQAPTKQAKATK